jgi:hypothetical protein
MPKYMVNSVPFLFSPQFTKEFTLSFLSTIICNEIMYSCLLKSEHAMLSDWHTTPYCLLKYF